MNEPNSPSRTFIIGGDAASPEDAAARARATRERAALEIDAARYRFLRELDPIRAQAFFWNYPHRRQRDAAIDKAISDENAGSTD